MTPSKLLHLCAGAALLAACDATKPQTTPSSSATTTAAAGVRSGQPSASATTAPTASAAVTVGVPVPEAPSPGKPGDGFATAEEGAAAVAHAIASERLAAFDVGSPTKALLDTTFAECNPKPATDLAPDMKLGVEAGLKMSKGRRPLQPVRLVEAQVVELEKGERYADCKVVKDVKLRVFGFLIHDADGKDAFADGGVGVSFYPLGDPPRYFISAPK